MLLFRSEEDAPSDGARVPVAQLNELAKRWYGDRLDQGWRPRSAAESQRLLDSVGLTADFWQLG